MICRPDSKTLHFLKHWKEKEKVEIEFTDNLCGYSFIKEGKQVQWSELSRQEQISVLNSFAQGYELFEKFLKEE